MLSKVVLLLVGVFLLSIQARSYGKEKVVYKYKKYEKFDLGSLKIKGDVVAPGDLTATNRGRKVFERKLMDRPNFNKEIKAEVLNLR